MLLEPWLLWTCPPPHIPPILPSLLLLPFQRIIQMDPECWSDKKIHWVQESEVSVQMRQGGQSVPRGLPIEQPQQLRLHTIHRNTLLPKPSHAHSTHLCNTLYLERRLKWKTKTGQGESFMVNQGPGNIVTFYVNVLQFMIKLLLLHAAVYCRTARFMLWCSCCLLETNTTLIYLIVVLFGNRGIPKKHLLIFF